MSARYTGGLVYNAPGGWSGYFDGSGDYLTAPDNAVFDFGSGNFTLEAIVFPLTSTPSSSVFGKRASGAVYAPFVVGFGGTLAPQLLVSFNGSTWGINFSSSFSCIAQTWNHIAVTRNGSTFTIWVNGQSGGTASSASAVMTNTTAVSIGATAADGTSSFNGYISNARIVKGTAVYTANFTPPTGALVPISGTSLLTCAYSTFRDGSTNNFTVTANGSAAVSDVNPFPTSQLPNPALGGAGNGVYTMSQYAALKAANLWPAFDPFYKNVTLNLHGNGTNAAQNNTFLDSSTNNFTITRNGNTTQGTFSPYGSNWSNYFDGSSYLSVASTSALAVGTGDFTFECWYYNAKTTWSAYADFIDGATNAMAIYTSTDGTLRIAPQNVASSSLGTISGTALNAWTHIAIIRNSGSIRAYVNGTALQAATSNTMNFSVAFTKIAGSQDGYLTGYLSNVRFINNANTYNISGSTITVPTAPLTAVSGTQLLTCQSNRFVDNSSNAIAISIGGGSPTVQRFSPFVSATEYSTSTIGGSGYFDGSGDYLSVANTAALGFGTGDFTIEFSTYMTAAKSAADSGYIFDLRFSSGNTCYMWLEDNVAYTVAINGVASSGTTPSTYLRQWVNWAIVRSSGTVKVYVNGVQNMSFTSSGSIGNSGITVGCRFNATEFFPGYIADFRVVKGTAVYTTTFTPPTAPLTAITNTSLLLSYTNAGILDNAMMNDLETVGNAQISTSVKKYGAGSMYFDGTGDWLACTPEPVQFGTGSFTIEAWAYPTASRYNPIITRNWSGNNRLILAITSSGAITVWVGHAATGWYTGTSSTTPCATLNAWYHIALVRNGSTVTAYVNGISVLTGSTTATMTDSNTTPLYIGYYFGDGSAFQGYIDDLRVTKGVARYTANFTPPTSQVQDQ